MKRTMMALALLASAGLAPLSAQQQVDSIAPERKLEGPRVGVTFITGTEASKQLQDNHLSPVMTLFGWHFEQVTQPDRGGTMFVAQEVLVVAGVEQGTAIPSASFLVGARFGDGTEFGVGPNLSPLGAALAFGVGRTERAGNVAIPLDFAVVHSDAGTRLTFLVGIAMRRR